MQLILPFFLHFLLLLKILLVGDEQVRFKVWKPLTACKVMWKDVRFRC